jgi:hypothetical protein
MLKGRQAILALPFLAFLSLGCSPSGPIPPKLERPDPPLESYNSAGDNVLDGSNDEDEGGNEKKRGKKQKPSDHDEASDPAWEYRLADRDCARLVTKRTMGSILTIFNRLRPGIYRTEYVACMRSRGYDVR